MKRPPRPPLLRRRPLPRLTVQAFDLAALAAGNVEAAAPTAAPPPTPVAQATVDAFDLAALQVGGSGAQSETISLSAEAAADALETHDAAIASVEAASAAGPEDGLPLSAEAPPRTPDARDVTIKAAEVEANTLYVAGEAPSGTLVRIYANDDLVGEVRAAADGTWLIEANKEVPVGEVVFRVEAVSEGSAPATQVVEASAPFMRFADGIVLEPVVSAVSEERALLSDAALSPVLNYVIIRRGDNLWRIARRNYGRGVKYQAIFAANRDRIRNPHRIFPGQVFVVPTRDHSWDTATQ